MITGERNAARDPPTAPVGDQPLAVPTVPIHHANLDAPRPPGGLFIDDAGNVARAVDARAPAPVMQAILARGAMEAANAFTARPN